MASHYPKRQMRDGEDHTRCGARGCGGLIRAVEAEILDGATHYCGTCGREHTYHVPFEDGPLSRSMESAPRKRAEEVSRGRP